MTYVLFCLFHEIVRILFLDELSLFTCKQTISSRYDLVFYRCAHYSADMVAAISVCTLQNTH